MRRGRWSLFFVVMALASAIAIVTACLPDYQFGETNEGGVNGEGGGGGGDGGDASSDGMASTDGRTDGPVPSDASGMIRLDAPDSGTFTFRLDVSGGGEGFVTVPFTTSFLIDRTEVTAGRYRAWSQGAATRPANLQSLDPGGPYQEAMKWHDEWIVALAPAGCGTGPASYGSPSTLTRPDPALPVTCVTWFDAVAFCASEGKRLVTEVEWQFAITSRGNRFYAPWTNSQAPTFDCDHVIFDLGGNGDAGGGCNFLDAGPALLGATEQGVLDMSGRVYEWIWDVGDPYPFQVDAGPAHAGAPDNVSVDMPHVRKGGAFNSKDGDRELYNWVRIGQFPGNDPYDDLGFRCAKSL